MSKRCLKHYWTDATHYLVVSGEKYPMCGDCAVKALKNDETLSDYRKEQCHEAAQEDAQG